MSNLTDQKLDAILDADGLDNPENHLALFGRIHERKRKRAHAKAKAVQPALSIRMTNHVDLPECACNGCLVLKLRAFWFTPLAPEDFDASAGAVDYLLQTVDDTLKAGDAEDAILAAFRVARKIWALNIRQLGPIEGLPKKKE